VEHTFVPTFVAFAHLDRSEKRLENHNHSVLQKILLCKKNLAMRTERVKTLLAIVSAFTLYATAASAVTWSVVTVSATVKIGSTTGNVITTVLSTRSYLDLVSTQFSVPKRYCFDFNEFLGGAWNGGVE
jgi:hypothetical protein